jgi:uncharacterized damage-inducible protein DinB
MFAGLDVRHPRGEGDTPLAKESLHMNKSTVTRLWDMMRMRHGVGLRCIEALPADQLDTRPVKDMRTPKELVVHMYSFMRAAAEGLLSGTLTHDEKTELAGVKTKQDLVKFAEQCWNAADTAAAKVTDAHLTGAVKAPWGDMKAADMFGTIQDEYLHHRGQLYAFLRQLGVQPPENWDFEGSVPAYQPKQHA